MPDWLWGEVASGRLQPAAVATFGAIARRANGKTGMGAYPSQGTIAEETGQNVRTVRRHIRDLEAVGAVRTIRRTMSGRGRTSDAFVVTVGDRLTDQADGAQMSGRVEGADGAQMSGTPGHQSPTNKNPLNQNSSVADVLEKQQQLDGAAASTEWLNRYADPNSGGSSSGDDSVTSEQPQPPSITSRVTARNRPAIQIGVFD
ncbi:helix-turn-helix domain-containing protein [Monashia sp. NPDC004114]